MNDAAKYYTSLVILTYLCIVCNLFLNIAYLLCSEGTGKSVMLWAFNKGHISPNLLFPVWKPIWSTAVLCRIGESLAYTRHYLYSLFQYCIFSSTLNIEAPFNPGVGLITVVPSVRTAVGIRHLKKLWYFVTKAHIISLTNSYGIITVLVKNIQQRRTRDSNLSENCSQNEVYILCLILYTFLAYLIISWGN